MDGTWTQYCLAPPEARSIYDIKFLDAAAYVCVLPVHLVPRVYMILARVLGSWLLGACV